MTLRHCKFTDEKSSLASILLIEIIFLCLFHVHDDESCYEIEEIRFRAESACFTHKNITLLRDDLHSRKRSWRVQIFRKIKWNKESSIDSRRILTWIYRKEICFDTHRYAVDFLNNMSFINANVHSREEWLLKQFFEFSISRFYIIFCLTKAMIKSDDMWYHTLREAAFQRRLTLFFVRRSRRILLI